MRPSDAAAGVYRHGSTVSIQPGIQSGGVTGTVAVHRQIGRRRHDDWRGFILDGEGGRRAAAGQVFDQVDAALVALITPLACV